MPEEDDLLSPEEESGLGESESAGKKKIGFLPGIVIQILKWIAAVIGATIFIITVVLITLRITNRGEQSQTYRAVSENYENAPEVLQWYSNIGEIRARSADEEAHTIIVEVLLGYKKENKSLQTELIDRTPRFKHIIRQYFASKTAEELRPENEDEILLELKERINNVLRSGEVKEVIFDSFNVVEF